MQRALLLLAGCLAAALGNPQVLAYERMEAKTEYDAMLARMDSDSNGQLTKAEVCVTHISRDPCALLPASVALALAHTREAHGWLVNRILRLCGAVRRWRRLRTSGSRTRCT